MRTNMAAENQWLHLSLISKLRKDCLEVFPDVEHAHATIPTYPAGEIGFVVCAKDMEIDLKLPWRSGSEEEEEEE